MPVAALNAIGEEVTAVEGKDLLQFQPFRQYNQRGVSQVHRRICVPRHELECARQTLVIQEENSQAIVGQKVHEALRADAGRLQEGERPR